MIENGSKSPTNSTIFTDIGANKHKATQKLLKFSTDAESRALAIKNVARRCNSSYETSSSATVSILRNSIFTKSMNSLKPVKTLDMQQQANNSNNVKHLAYSDLVVNDATEIDEDLLKYLARSYSNCMDVTDCHTLSSSGNILNSAACFANYDETENDATEHLENNKNNAKSTTNTNNNSDEKSLFKTASYKKELPRNAIRTKLKKSFYRISTKSPQEKTHANINNNYTNSSDTEDELLFSRSNSSSKLKSDTMNFSDEHTTFRDDINDLAGDSTAKTPDIKTKTIKTTNVIDSPTGKTTTTITTITTKTLIKLNDLNRRKHMCKITVYI